MRTPSAVLALAATAVYLCSSSAAAAFALAAALCALRVVSSMWTILFAEAEPEFRFVSLAYSHYVERLRWALDAAGVSYVEEQHTVLRGIFWNGTTVPVLECRGRGVINDSSDAIRFLAGDTDDPDVRALLDVPAADREFERMLTRRLARSVRIYGYHHALESRAMFKRMLLSDSAPWYEHALVHAGYTRVCSFLIRKLLRINEASAKKSLTIVHETFAAVSERLSGGRKYLSRGGERFGSLDITFAALAAPALIPAEFGGVPLVLEEMSDEYQRFVRELRQTPAGKHALRMYREHRAGKQA